MSYLKILFLYLAEIPSIKMIDIDHSVEKLISALPVAPGVPSGLCDRTFLGPQGPADYILHMDPKSQLDVWDSECFVSSFP